MYVRDESLSTRQRLLKMAGHDPVGEKDFFFSIMMVPFTRIFLYFFLNKFPQFIYRFLQLSQQVLLLTL